MKKKGEVFHVPILYSMWNESVCVVSADPLRVQAKSMQQVRAILQEALSQQV